MDVNTLLQRIENPELLISDKSFEWNSIIEKYPFFSMAQMLKLGHDTLTSNGNIQLAALYKKDPILFVQFANQLEEIEKKISLHSTRTSKGLNNTIELTPVLEIVENTKAAELNTIDTTDIVELIEQLPLVESEESQIKDINKLKNDLSKEDDADKSLMVMMSFNDWLQHFKNKTTKEREEEQSQKALKTAWQKEKLSAAVGEEQDEIPEQIFKQAMDSITQESTMISESLAGILAKQGKTDKAIDMYKKLSLRNPEKSAYFASLIQDLNF